MDITIRDNDEIRQVDKFFIDEPCVVSFFVGELGWLVQRWQGYLRHLKHNVYKDHKFFMMLNSQYHVLVHDFVSCTLDLPEEFYKLGLETDCYEAPLPNSAPGSLTPTEVYIELINYIRQFYNPEKAIEIWPPRGVNMWVDMQPQLFIRYTTEALVSSNRPIVTVFPRGRSRASFRNVPPHVWKEVVDLLSRTFDVVLCGTPSGACLADYKAPGVENLIGKADLERVLHVLNNSVCSVSSQSGPTHLSLLSMCPAYIIGHEQKRHTEAENRFGTPTSFRYLQDYRAIDAPTIIQDLYEFIRILQQHDEFNSKSRRTLKPLTRALVTEERKDVVGAILAYDNPVNIGNIVNLVDLKKLYLIGSLPEESIMQELRDRLNEYDNFNKICWLTKPIDEAIDDIEEELDFVYSDAFLSRQICQEYFFKLKSGGLFGSGSFSEWEKLGWPLPYRRVTQGVECDIHSRYKDKAPFEGWFVRMGGLLRHSFKNLVDKKDLVGAEIGVYFGENSKAILDNLDIQHLYLIDPYDKGLVGIEDNPAPDFILNSAIRLLSSHTDKIQWVREKSQDAASNIPDELDFVYIDGDHTYEGAKSDLDLYWPKIKEGGMLGGHDFDNEHVARAVKEFFEDKNDIDLFTSYDSEGTLEFWVYKIDNLYQHELEKGFKDFDRLVRKRFEDA